jgi:glutamine synthetase
MFKEFSEAASYIKNNEIRMVDLKFCDLWGRWHHVTISATEFIPGLMESGVGFDGSSIGLKNVKSGDMALVPDLSTGFQDPFWDSPTLSFVCHIVEADSKIQFQQDPRFLLRRAEQFLKSSGIADESRWGPEFEFYIFSDIAISNTVNESYYSIDSPEGFWNNAVGGQGYLLPKHGGYHAIPPADQFFNLRNKMVLVLEDIGIPVKYHHHEVGGPGQCEIETPILGAVQSADAAMHIKYITKMVAHQAGFTVTFLPKPLYGEAGSGMHFHQQLLKNNKNIFYDGKQRNLLSQIARFYIGGLLTHAPAVLAFTNPSTNSYRRLVPGYEAPVNCFFSSGNRSAAIRVPKYATKPGQVRFEFRPPDATCNPYLAEAAMLMAGMDGINRKIDPTAAGFGPIDDDIFSWTDEKRSAIKSLPTSLGAAVQALSDDHDFLLAGDIFKCEMIESWIRSKKQEEYEVNLRPHPFEIEKYYDL